MADSPDRTELQPPAEGPVSGARRAPYALLAAAGVGVATACAALASFAVASGDEARTGDNVPPVVTQVNNSPKGATPLSGGVSETPSSAETSPAPGSPPSTSSSSRPRSSGTPQPGQPNDPGQQNPPLPPPGGGGNGGGGNEPPPETTSKTTTSSGGSSTTTTQPSGTTTTTAK
ncbi:hypothetical protein JOF56_004095 [Kibdelosporangium banguiense]|uniref:Serine/threonine protein kinase n=1 Tax=Kibdelosporangium banguiense TaxID=1365924 RepID=A0ABS4TH03_9PSEU|nr:hypothetical protein [Kibdelosporangium banguiense]MBP2323710.1 hypothetical protein [Kibdelosporangium banguiense]